MSTKTINIISALFIFHGIQNIIGFTIFNPEIRDNIVPLVTFPPELFGGVFSLGCAYLIRRKTDMARLAVLLRTIGGVFSLSTLFTTISSINMFVSLPVFLSGLTSTENPYTFIDVIFGLLRVGAVLFFIVVAWILLKNMKEYSTKEVGLVKVIISGLLIIMTINWLWSFSFIYNLGI